MRKPKRKQKHSERFRKLESQVEDRLYEVPEAIELVRKLASAKFVESVEMAIKLGVDPKKSDQNVRGTTNIPHGTGKNQKVAVLASGEAAAAAEAAGADTVGAEELIAQIQQGWRDFDVMLATSNMAPQIGKIGRFLGPKTPNKRNGTVTDDIATAVKEIKGATRIEYRVEKAGIVHVPIGKVNFTADQLRENLLAALDAVIRAKPAAAKGRYLESITISSSMGPGIRLDPATAGKSAAL